MPKSLFLKIFSLTCTCMSSLFFLKFSWPTCFCRILVKIWETIRNFLISDIHQRFVISHLALVLLCRRFQGHIFSGFLRFTRFWPFTNYCHLSLMNGVNEMWKIIFSHLLSYDWLRHILAEISIGRATLEEFWVWVQSWKDEIKNSCLENEWCGVWEFFVEPCDEKCGR